MASKYERYNHDKDDPTAELEHEDHPLDRGTVLSKYGFSTNKCQKCGVSNSEIDGKLIQCGKCKRSSDYHCYLYFRDVMRRYRLTLASLHTHSLTCSVKRQVSGHTTVA